MTEDEYQVLLARMQGLGAALSDANQVTTKREKYGRRKKEVNGIMFDSTAEARRYIGLAAMEQAKAISGLTLQPRFLLQEAFTDEQGRKHRKSEMVADFQYLENGKTVVEDVKGMRLPTFKLKWKLAIKRFPNVEFREIRC